MSKFENIFYAAEKGTVEDVRYFVESKGINAKEPNSNGWTPLHFAAKSNSNVDVLKYLVQQYGDAVNAETTVDRALPLHHAASLNPSVAVLEYLLALPEADAYVNKPNGPGMTPLHCAALSNPNAKVLECLLQHGATVDLPDIGGKTALDFVAFSAFALANRPPDLADMPMDFGDPEEKKRILQKAMQRR